MEWFWYTGSNFQGGEVGGDSDLSRIKEVKKGIGIDIQGECERSE